MTWFTRKRADVSRGDVQPTPDVVSPRDLTTQDLMRFFRERGTSVPDAVRYSAFFAGFAAASLVSATDAMETDAEAQRLLKSARDAIDEGFGAVRAALDSDVGKTLKSHKFI